MAFLKNDGDIILDAVLTDAGRRRLAAGDGTFKITKFALGDDEINYTLHDSTKATAEQDLNIGKTPVLEAFTNNKASIKHRLVTLDDNELLYLPLLKLNTLTSTGKPFPDGINANIYPVICTEKAYDYYSQLPTGFIDGSSATDAGEPAQLISLDHGIDTGAENISIVLADELTETAFDVFLDNRFGRIVTPTYKNADGEEVAAADVSRLSVENDIAHYLITVRNSAHFEDIRGATTHDQASVVQGSRAPQRFKFGVRASDPLVHSTYLFTKFGTTTTGFFTSTGATSGTDALTIDTTIRVIGQKTGLSIDIPVRFVREP